MTETTTHTPGPWLVEQDEKGRRKVVCDAYEDERPGICGDYSKHWRLLDCDAVAIAAVPKLLAALKLLRIDANRLADRNQGGTYEADVRRAIKVADEAIDEAEGRA